MKLLKLFLLLLVTTFAFANAFAAKKNLSVPQLDKVNLKLDGKLSEPVWKKAATFTQKDMFLFRDKKKPTAKTLVYLLSDKNNLYVALAGIEKKDIILPKKNASLWSREYIELFIGLNGEDDWYRQIAFSLGNHSYNEFIEEKDLIKKFYVNKNKWSCEVVIPLSKLKHFDNNSVKFNVLRKSLEPKELQTWADISWGHDLDKFNSITFVKDNQNIAHGPWTFDVSDTSCSFAWNSKGKNFTFAIKKVNDKKFTTLPVVSKNDIHYVVAKNLTPNTVYQYKVNNQSVKTIKTLVKEPADFDFSFTTDIHCRNYSLAKLLNYTEVKKSDMIFCLGDMVTAIVGKNTLYEALLDVFSTNWNKPFYYARGNHEHRGYKEYFFDLVSPAKRQSFDTFLHKGVYFVILDTDGDFEIPKDYLARQAKALEKAVNSKEFANAQFRVLLSHKALNPTNAGGGSQINEIFASLPSKIQKSFDLALAGHVHCYNKAMPNSNKIYSNHKKYNGIVIPKENKRNFPVLTNMADGILVVKKTANKLETIVYNDQGKVIDKVIVNRK